MGVSEQIRYVYNVHVQGLGLDFNFPFHVYHKEITEIIAGNDFFKILRGAPRPHKSEIVVELTDEEATAPEDLPDAIQRGSQRRDRRAAEYRKQLTAHPGRQGLRVAGSRSLVRSREECSM